MSELINCRLSVDASNTAARLFFRSALYELTGDFMSSDFTQNFYREINQDTNIFYLRVSELFLNALKSVVSVSLVFRVDCLFSGDFPGELSGHAFFDGDDSNIRFFKAFSPAAYDAFYASRPDDTVSNRFVSFFRRVFLARFFYGSITWESDFPIDDDFGVPDNMAICIFRSKSDLDFWVENDFSSVSGNNDFSPSFRRSISYRRFRDLSMNGMKVLDYTRCSFLRKFSRGNKKISFSRPLFAIVNFFKSAPIN